MTQSFCFNAICGGSWLLEAHCFAKYCCLILEGARPQKEPQEHLLDRSLQVCIFARNFLHPILNKTIDLHRTAQSSLQSKRLTNRASSLGVLKNS